MSFFAAMALVAALVARRRPMVEITDEIDRLPLTRTERDLLWVYAWCGGKPSELRQLVTET